MDGWTITQVVGAIVALIGAIASGALIERWTKATIDLKRSKVEDKIKAEQAEAQMGMEEQRYKDAATQAAYDLLTEQLKERIAAIEEALKEVHLELRESRERERQSLERERICMMGQETLRGDLRVCEAKIQMLSERISRHDQATQEQIKMNNEAISLVAQGKGVPAVPIVGGAMVGPAAILAPHPIYSVPTDGPADVIRKAADDIQHSTVEIKEQLPTTGET